MLSTLPQARFVTPALSEPERAKRKAPLLEGGPLSVSYAFASLHSRPRLVPSVMGLVTCFYLLPRYCFTNYKLLLGCCSRRTAWFNCLKRRFNRMSSRSGLQTSYVSKSPVILLNSYLPEVLNSWLLPNREAVRETRLNLKFQTRIFFSEETWKAARNS